jgi:4-hydroxybenzoyl-CoA thioesterase
MVVSQAITGGILGTFHASRLVRFGHCDPAGIAYFPAYIDMLNGVVEDFWTDIGHPWTDQLGRRHMGTPTAHLSCDFVRPSRHGDRLLFSMTVVRLGRASLEFAHSVTRAGEPVWSARQVLVAMDMKTGASQRWPDDIRTALQAFIDRDDAPPEG